MNKSSKAICIAVMSLFLAQSAQANPVVRKILRDWAVPIIVGSTLVEVANAASAREAERSPKYKNCKDVVDDETGREYVVCERE